MAITPSALQDLRDRADTCRYLTDGIRHFATATIGDAADEIDSEMFERDQRRFRENLSAWQQRLASASAAFDGKAELLEFVRVVGALGSTAWPFKLVTVHTAHAWFLTCGSILSRWDGRLRRLDDDGPPTAVVTLPGEPVALTHWLTFDDAFKSTLDLAADALELEYRRAVERLLSLGGSVDLDGSTQAPGDSSRNPERDAYIVRRRDEGASLKTIMAEVAARPEWDRLDSKQAVSKVLARRGQHGQR